MGGFTFLLTVIMIQPIISVAVNRIYIQLTCDSADFTCLLTVIRMIQPLFLLTVIRMLQRIQPMSVRNWHCDT